MPTYETVIGIEIHVKLNTESKMFCSCSNKAFGAAANSSVCQICMGFPGLLPVTNAKAVELGTKLSLALGCTINAVNKFDRKNYFYPDLPKGYQISQFDVPLAEHGRVEFLVGQETSSVGITRLHLEEDAGKLLHEGSATLVDLNRAGAPLAEIVTEPDFRSAEQVGAFLRELQAIARVTGAGTADMEKGEMRCDVNISIRPVGQEAFGTKVELKNMNSFAAVEKAIAYEQKRQAEILESGGNVAQETRGWDDTKNVSESQRSKENANDYRYFPEPDLPPLVLDSGFIEGLRQSLPELPAAKRKRYMAEWKIKEDDAKLLSLDADLSAYFEEVATLTKDPVKSANVLLSVLVALLKEDKKDIAQSPVTATQLATLITKVAQGEISGSAMKEVLEELYRNGGEIDAIIASKGLAQISDAGEITRMIEGVLSANAAMVEQYKSGTTKVFGALVGEVMKASKGKANPALVNEVLKGLLDSHS